MHGVVGEVTLGVTGVVTLKTIAATAEAGEIIGPLRHFGDLIELKVEEARVLAVHESDADARQRFENGGQGAEVEALVHEKRGGGEARREIEFAPEILRLAGEDRFGTGLVAMQVLGNFQDAVEVGAGRAIAAVLLGLLKSAFYQVFCQDRFLAMGAVRRGGGLKIETEGTTIIIAELSKLTDVISCDHHVS